MTSLHTDTICDAKHLNKQEKFLAKILVFTRVKYEPPPPFPSWK